MNQKLRKFISLFTSVPNSNLTFNILHIFCLQYSTFYFLFVVLGVNVVKYDINIREL